MSDFYPMKNFFVFGVGEAASKVTMFHCSFQERFCRAILFHAYMESDSEICMRWVFPQSHFVHVFFVLKMSQMTRQQKKRGGGGAQRVKQPLSLIYNFADQTTFVMPILCGQTSTDSAELFLLRALATSVPTSLHALRPCLLVSTEPYENAPKDASPIAAEISTRRQHPGLPPSVCHRWMVGRSEIWPRRAAGVPWCPLGSAQKFTRTASSRWPMANALLNTPSPSSNLYYLSRPDAIR